MRRDEAGQAAGARKLFQPRRPRGEGQTAGRVPQVMQMESVECGAACLAMVCAYWGKWVPLDELRRMCGVGRDGAKAGNIARAAQRLGMEVHAYRFEPERLREKATFPCIVHWNAYHFVVVRGFKRGRVLINDPARGAYACDWEEFDRSFTGVCICMQPGEAFEPGGARPSVRRFILENLRDAKGALAFVAFTTLLSAFVGLMNPALSQVFVTRLLVERNENWLAPFMAVLVGVCVIQVATEVLSAVYLLKVQGKLDVSAASRFMWKALHLPVDFFSQRSVGDVSGRMSTTTRVSKELVSLVAPLVINMGMLAVYLVILVCYSPMLASVGLAATLVNVVCAIVVARQRTEISRVQARDWANLSAASLAGIQTIETIKASGAENGFFRQWAVYQAQANTQTVRSQNLSVSLGVVPQVASAVSNALVLVLGLLLVMQGEFTVGMVLAFQGYLAQFAAPAQQLVESLQALSEMRVDIERIEDVLTAQDDPALAAQGGSVPKPASLPQGRLEMRDVSFGYNALEAPLIKGLNLVVEPGRSVALVGGSGSGKSTIASLADGLVQPWEGQVLLDGADTRHVSRDVFTYAVSMVCQEPTIFAGTVADNIAMWDPAVSDAQIMRAARDAALHDEVLAMPGGYRHMLAEGGANLSGGQRQRVEIARALVRDPRILILDEATSALDAQTEERVMHAVRARGITLLIVAHRLSTVRDCDEIVVLDHGEVVERGRHDELMAAGGAYAALVRQG